MDCEKSPIHENTNAKITCDFGDDRCRIATAQLEKDIFVKTHLHTAHSSIDMMEQITTQACSMVFLHHPICLW